MNGEQIGGIVFMVVGALGSLGAIEQLWRQRNTAGAGYRLQWITLGLCLVCVAVGAALFFYIWQLPPSNGD